MRKSVVKGKLGRNEPVLLTSLLLNAPALYELVSLMGFHGVWMDLEHHPTSAETAEALMRASRVGNTDILARPAKGEMMRLGRLLEAGATGILYPRCSNAAEAEAVVRAAKFYPLGERGYDGSNPDQPYSTMPADHYVRIANEETFIFVQIEDAGALAEAEAMAAVEGVDGLFFGPVDFSVLSGIPGKLDRPIVQEAIDTVASAARNTGKHWGMPVVSAEAAAPLMERGARILACSADLALVKAGMETLQEDFAQLGLEFDNQLRG